MLPVVHEETIRANSDLQTYNAQPYEAVRHQLHPTFYQSYEVITGDGRTSTRTIVRPCSDPGDTLLDATLGPDFRTTNYPYKNERIKGDGKDKTVETGNFYLYDKADLDQAYETLSNELDVGRHTGGAFGRVHTIMDEPLFTVEIDGKTYYASKDLISL